MRESHCKVSCFKKGGGGGGGKERSQDIRKPEIFFRPFESYIRVLSKDLPSITN